MLKRFGLTFLIVMTGNFIFAAKIWSEPQVGLVLNSSQSSLVFTSVPGVPDPNEIFRLVNKARANSNAPPLRANKILSVIAAQRAADMAQRQYYAHKNPEGHYFYDLFPNFAISPNYSCENLDLVFVPDSQSVIPEWAGSTHGHRACMLDNSLVEAGYATTKLMLIDFNGHATSAYLVVAIHTTEI